MPGEVNYSEHFKNIYGIVKKLAENQNEIMDHVKSLHESIKGIHGILTSK